MQEASGVLSALEQSLELEYALLPLNNVLVQNSFLLHKDKEVRLLLAVCFCEIIRILAPKPPFSDEVFKVVTFHFASLSDCGNPRHIVGGQWQI